MVIQGAKSRFFYKILFSVTLLLCLSHSTFATHNRAGEITYEQTGELTIRATITTYTKTSSQSVDRDSLEIFWGDGTSEFIYRSNGNGDELQNDVKRNFYIGEHSYPGRATYTLSIQDPNRVDGIVNVNAPNSIEVPFFLETTFTFLNTQFQGFNNSARLLQAPLDVACVGKPFVHNPNAFDSDGDSLSFELVVPLQSEGNPVPDYFYPNQITPGPNNQLTLNPNTGTLRWQSPQTQGEYNIAIQINEYRDGVRINSIIRDMQILVLVCDNEPPEIDVVDEICVVAGELIDLEVLVSDPDEDDIVQLTASGSPFEGTAPEATLTPSGDFLTTPYSARFTWQTDCSDISKQPYQIVFRAVDIGINATQGLADLKTLRIFVVGPQPQIVETQTEAQAIRINWESPYDCQDAADDYFEGFSVWRRLGSNPFGLDKCQPGLDGQGYTKIEFLTTEIIDGQYTYLDDDVEKGQTYCYRILGEFARKTPTGNTFNRVESLASEELCQQLARDIPLLTKVSVTSTNQLSGEIEINWVKPLAQELDTVLNPGPYRYVLERALDIGGPFVPVLGAEYITPSFAEALPLSFLDSNLDTEGTQYYYRMAFYANGTNNFYDNSSVASSVHLNSSAGDKFIDLAWNASTPWQNYKSFIYQKEGGTFVLIDSTEESSFRVNGLTNGIEECFLVETEGTYGILDITNPIFNFSQESCATPIDLVPPCPISLRVESVCQDQDIQNLGPEDLINTLIWQNPNIFCENTNDVISYTIYYSQLEGDDFEVLTEISGAENIAYEHNPDLGILGCYAVSSTDFQGNESELSNTVCIDNCPFYELPNAFSPNQDGANDLYVPRQNKFIERVDFKVFNRWGNLVFQTNDPALLWDGNDQNGNELSDGTYYYTCAVFEQRVEGVLEGTSLLRGNILMVR